jgi:tol-pal system protein YbgF
MFLKIFIYLVTFLWLNYFFQACSSLQKNTDNGVSEDERRQKEELDEIESLLGITPEERNEAKKETWKKGDKSKETLGLLDSDRALIQSQTPVENTTKTVPSSQVAQEDKEKKQIENELMSLKSQLNEKDMIIADLKAQLSFQSEQLKAQSSGYSSESSSYNYAHSMATDVSMDYQQKYDNALELFHARDYHGAIEIFESLLASSADNSLADNAQYWIGESHYALGQYDKAIIDFEKVFTFPKSNKNPDAQYKLGLCYQRKGDLTKSREEFQRLIDLYPKSEYSRMAKEKLTSF